MARLVAFLQRFESAYIPLAKESALAYWDASVTGKSEDWARQEEANKKMNVMFSNKEDFKELKAIKEHEVIADPILKRQLDIVYNYYLGSQVDVAKLDVITALATTIEKRFNEYRTEYKGAKMNDNEVLQILKTSTDSAELEAVWVAQKKLGPLVAADTRRLVKLRNETATELGFKNYYDMSLRLGEEDPEQVALLLDDLDTLTRDMYASQKCDMDIVLATQYKLPSDQLRPWHYHGLFLQEAPKIYPIDYDSYFAGKDITKLVATFYASIGFNIEDILARSDLLPRTGKHQQAFCMCMDRENDIRVLSNNIPNYCWIGTMLHECGHALYYKHIDQKLPYLLREAAHLFTTEAIALLFERHTRSGSWIRHAVGITEAESKTINVTSKKATLLDKLIFTRWVLVVWSFERSMYENPDQDLNKLWNDIIRKHQLLEIPADRQEPDWATKVHIVSAPCYYHNYLLGGIFTAQVAHYIATYVLTPGTVDTSDYHGQPSIGTYLKERVFAPGCLYPWNEMITRATGEGLTPKYYAQELGGT